MNQHRKLLGVGARWFAALAILGVGLLCQQPGLFGQQRPPRKAPPGKAPAKAIATPSTAAAVQAKYKGIWEPVNYPEDVHLADVYFLTPDVGWAVGNARSEAGEGGFIIHTRDGGQTWIIQAGDPHSATGSFSRLHFFDETHGWVRQSGEQFYRTTDGETWELLGYMSSYVADYQFVSPTTGFYVLHNKVFQTQDGGRNWKEVYACQLRVEVEGLTRQVTCEFAALHFVSPSVGYAVSGEIAPKTLAVAKTEDGGATWSAWAVPDVGSPREVFFIDENVGFLWIWYNAIYRTTDGGRTWAGLVGDHPGGPIKFADPEVGWLFLGNSNFPAPSTLTYTTDGGKRWVSRSVPFPTSVNAFSLPRRDRAYVVGDHGMIYRYRVVPANEQVAAKAVPAPAMPVFDSPLDEQVEQLQGQVATLEEEVKKEQGEAAPAAEQAGGGEAGSKQGGAAGSEGSGLVENCCAEKVEQIQATVEAVATEVPKFTGKYRNLNLIFSGLQMVGQLFGQAQGLKDSLKALRQARDPAAVTAALTELTGQVTGLVQSTKVAFQSPGQPQEQPKE